MYVNVAGTKEPLEIFHGKNAADGAGIIAEGMLVSRIYLEGNGNRRR